MSAAAWFGRLHGRQDGLFYRGVKKGGGGLGWGALGKGLYLTWQKGVAEFFAEGGPVYTYEIPADLNLLDAQSKEMADIKADMGFQPWEYSDSPMFQSVITSQVRRLGYEGVISDNPADGFVIFDPEDVVVLVEEE